MVLEFLKKLMDMLIQFFKYKEVKQNSEEIKNEKVDNLIENVNKKIEEKIDEVNDAVDNNDVDKINVIINRILLPFILFSSLVFNGCITKYVPVYVQEDEKVIYEEKDGKAGFWVPQSTMRKLLTYKVKWEAYLEAQQNGEK